ncbi:MAG: ribonuclease III [Solitalea-like symbiont of Tyrophagus putrescentiae]
MKLSISKLISNKLFNNVFRKHKTSLPLVFFLKDIFNIKPNNIELYKLAIRHKSKSRTIKGTIKNSNERLEFLGDAILNCIITDLLFRKYPYKSEGFLTELRARIVNRNFLNDLASKIGIDKYINCSSDFKTYFSSRKESLLGNALEALIGAIYLDRGYDISYKCIKKLIDNYVQLDILACTETNYKSRLIEFCQKHNKKIDFNLAAINNKPLRFTITINIDEKEISRGTGSNKKNAEMVASEVAYKQLVC